ncbi:hypothetical protein CH063_13475 [Colletotrichum higginsianum]|uniref:Uncharacterized protein n=1 Tax=Colletotrichum higginsianum (strain IMI 349063) TaxID=759273 RepID=H1VUJ5_COLHI|nr:hypothetical protein CH063_13475 [Colletotrichum higginsianum]
MVRLRRKKLACFGIAWCCIMSSVLMTPATPEAASAWPMLSLTEPRYTGPVRRGPEKVLRTLSYSIGSPTLVPVSGQP